jgi:hypothetical protein
MKQRFERTEPISGAILDRLVDGELTAAEENELLFAMDNRPECWRHCALAFIESRRWKAGFQALILDKTSPINGAPNVCGTHAGGQTAPVVSISPREPGPVDSDRRRMLLVAASVTLAFVCGLAVDRHWRMAAGTNPGIVTYQPSTPHDETVQRNQAARPGASLANQPPAGSTVTMELVDDQGNVQRQFGVPIVEASQFPAGFLQRDPSAIPDEVVEALRQSGHTVQEQRLLVPVWLDDGRPAILPVDRAAVTYAGVQF